MVVDAGGIIVEIYVNSTDQTSLTAWVNAYKIPVTSMQDPPGMANQSITALQRREYCFIVEIPSMTVKDWLIGSTNGTGISTAKTGMDEMLQLLGKPPC